MLNKKPIDINDFKEKDNEKRGNVIDWENLQYLKRERKGTIQPHQYTNDRFIGRVNSALFEMARLKDILKSPMLCLFNLLFWCGNKKGGPNKDAARWYNEKKLIVATQSQEQMSIDLGVSEKTIGRWTKLLEMEGLILIEKDGLENVYVLGQVYDDGSEGYYYCGSAIPYRKHGRTPNKKRGKWED